MSEKYLLENETYKIIGAAMEVHRQLGCGFTEKVYQDALEKEFLLRGIPYKREVHLHVTYKGEALNSDFIPDFICYDCIIVELKAVQELDNLHRAQAINYTRVASMDLSLLINFGALSLEHERLYNKDSAKKTSTSS